MCLVLVKFLCVLPLKLLSVGHFMALCLMQRLQMAMNKPVVLLGGGVVIRKGKKVFHKAVIK